MTEKCREFAVATKRKSAITHEKEFRRKLNAFNALVSESRSQDEIKSELQNTTVFTDSILQKFMEWSDLIEDPTELRPITDMRNAVQNLWESARRAASQRMQFLEERN